MDRIKTVPPPRLETIYAYVTDGCNCSCRHCWIVPPRPERKRAVRHLEPEILESAVKEALPLGLSALRITGGEPTTHPRLDTLLEVQHRHGLRGSLETNAMEVTRDLARSLRRLGTATVSVSLDGAGAAIHDSVRDLAGAFDRALRGLGFLVEAGYRPQITMSLMKSNLHQVEPLLELARSLGAEAVKLNLTQPTLRGETLHRRSETLEVPQVLELQRRVLDELTPRFPFRVVLDVPMAFRPLGEMARGPGVDCCGIFNILGLLADGSYALCGIGTQVPDLLFGSAGRDSLAALWTRNPVLARLRRGLPRSLGGVCGRCLMSDACLGACVAQNVYRTGDLFAPFWFCAEAERLGLFPASRLRPSGGDGG